ncbi:glycoside hydrolase [Polyplosphaeria fusca]|uniref:AA9 family lytic polysaccharide monooxygenase n=1 Tax=Polyplosphaeria fusca TaxID=682080 RepID=A0A9P4UZ43_9PLEO|nr:glycoside hydrolase [Polyplosphaeria fusca]
MQRVTATATAAVAAVFLLTSRATAHGGALNYTVGDTWYPGYDPYGPPTQLTSPSIPQRKWITTNPIFEATNASLACNAPGTPVLALIPVPAGSNLTAVYYSWVHTVGPMLVWMTPCPSPGCSTFIPNATTPWFKIAERGLLSGTVVDGMWFQHEFSNWDGSPSLWSERIPGALASGEYLVRHEIVSLHSANRPQWYVECVQVRVEGGEVGGVRVPGEEYLARIPGVWSMDGEWHGVGLRGGMS